MKSSNAEIENISEAKRRLLELERAEEKQVSELACQVELDSHFKTRSSYVLIGGQIAMIIVTLFEIYYYAVRPEAVAYNDFLSAGLIIPILIFLIYQMDGLIRARNNEKKLNDLQHKIKTIKKQAEKLLISQR